MLPEELLGVGIGREKYALVRRDPGSHFSQELVRSFSGGDDLGPVLQPGRDEEIIGQRSRSSIELVHEKHPGSHHESDEHHRQWASLWDAIASKMGVANAERERVMYTKVFLVTSVRSENPRWDPRYLRGVVK